MKSLEKSLEHLNKWYILVDGSCIDQFSLRDPSAVTTMDRGSAAAGGILLHLDIHVDEDKPRLGIHKLLKTLRPQWKTDDIQMKVFTEGITNRLTGCYVGSLQQACVLVRVYGRSTELYLDRQREVEMFQLLHAHHRGPLIYCSFHNGICYEFVRGEVLEDRLLRQPSIFRLIAAEMGRIHSIQPPAPGPGEPVLWARMSKLLTLVRDNVQDGPDNHSPQNVPGLPSHKVLSDEMETLKKHLSDTLSPVVLCHNDLLTKNIIYNLREGTVKFIDYEYADYNYQAFDIGNHFNEFAGVSDMDSSRYPGRGLQREWLRAYLESYRGASGRPAAATETEVTALYIQVCKFSLASNFFWGLWAMLQSHFSAIAFDFKRYATDRLHFYFQKKAAYFKLTEV